MAIKTLPRRRVELPGAADIITPVDAEFGSSGLLRVGRATGGISTWPTTKKPIGVPFYLNVPRTVYKLGWRNGSGTMTDSFDLGVYDAAWNRKVAGGGTARSGASAWQWVDTADTLLIPGKYWLVAANLGVTANNSSAYSAVGSAAAWAFATIFDSTTDSYPLPDPLSALTAAATFLFLPVMGIALRSDAIG